MKPVIFQFPERTSLGDELIKKLSADAGEMLIRTFPDGETYLRVLTPVENRDVIVIATIAHPNDKVLDLLFLANGLRSQKANKISLFAPYLPYMRQDKIFNPGEVLTSKIFAHLISRCFDNLVTVDPHLHRYHSLSEIYTIPTVVLQAAPLISKWIEENVLNPFIIGPDSESSQWAKSIAGSNPYIVLSKVRNSEGQVKITWPTLENLDGKTPVLVDDIISSGDTMTQAVEHLRELGGVQPVCIAIHPIFANNSYKRLIKAGAQKIVTCNSIPHESNRIDLSPLLLSADLKTSYL